MSPLEYAAMQFVILHPLVFPIAVTGVGVLVGAKRYAAYRPLGWAYLFIFVVFSVLHAKFYYLVPIYPMVLAAGAAAIEQYFACGWRTRLKPALTAGIVVGCSATLPYAVPLLPLDKYVTLDDWLRINREVRFEQGRRREQHVLFADMVGWPELVAGVARAYSTLPPAEQNRCTILTANYGEAAAIDRFGPQHGLPHAVCGHNNYYLWGPGAQPWDVVLAVGFDQATLAALFDDVAPLTVIAHPYAREGRVELCRCERLRMPRDEAWGKLKLFR